jgi:hypothetical protein
MVDDDEKGDASQILPFSGIELFEMRPLFPSRPLLPTVADALRSLPASSLRHWDPRRPSGVFFEASKQDLAHVPRPAIDRDRGHGRSKLLACRVPFSVAQLADPNEIMRVTKIPP